ncbi:MAG TPA: hypothetical protein VN253_22145, partial [Kofleriaceae bacterium]|nr:hypothetical protein [Kofleriaceae bacterium]
PAPRGAPTPTPAPAPRGAPTPTPAPASSAPGSKPRRDEPASKLPPGGGNKPTKLSGVETEPIDWLQTDPTSVDRGDYLDPSGELLRAPSPERRIAARPMPAPSPEPIAPPRRFAAGTRPGGATKIGVMPAPPRLDDDYTMPNLSLGDSTVLDVSLSDRTNPGLAIGTARGVTATRPVAVPGLRNRPAR